MQRNKEIEQDKGAMTSAYLALLFVVFIWGCSPTVYNWVFSNGYASPLVFTASISLVSALALVLLSAKHFGKLHKKYFLLAIPTGLFNSTASLLQKIGLGMGASPTMYAFLENLSCVIVPVLLFFFIKKKPSFLTITASLLCLLSAFVLSGMRFSFGVGEILCALSGVLYGVNIAATGAFAKDLFAPLYVMIQMCVQTVLAFIMAFSFNAISVGGKAMETLVFTWDVMPILCVVGLALVSNTLCWLVRTNSLKKIDASIVAVIMPFSAVVTGIISVAMGTDVLSWNLVLGAILGVASAILSGLSDTLTEKWKAYKQKKERIQPPEK